MAHGVPVKATYLVFEFGGVWVRVPLVLTFFNVVKMFGSTKIPFLAFLRQF